MPILRPILRPILSPLTRAIGAAGGGGGFSPLSLFASGEQGAWYDPSDLSSMFVDSAGTTAASVGQPVGLIFDKRKGLVRGSETVTNGGFDSDTSWTKGAGWSISGGVLAGVPGTASNTQQDGILVVGKVYEVTYEVKSVSAGSCQLLIGSGTAALSTSLAGTFRGVFTCSGNNILYVNKNSTFNGTIDNISVRELPGNHATQATTALKPILRQSGSLYYLEFDGVDDGMVTASIDFTATDKMTVFAGMRKLSDAATGVFCELTASSAANNGAFHVVAPSGLDTYRYEIASRGTTRVSLGSALATYIGAVTNVVTAALDISAPAARIRVNQSEATSIASQGTGTYSNAPIYIGRRGGASLPFSGHLYSLVVRGAASTAAQITSAESYTATKTGITL